MHSDLPPTSLSMVGKRRKGGADGKSSLSWYCITVCCGRERRRRWSDDGFNDHVVIRSAEHQQSSGGGGSAKGATPADITQDVTSRGAI